MRWPELRRVLLLLLLQRLEQVQARRLRHRTDHLLLRPLEPEPGLGSERPQSRTRRQLLPLVLGPRCLCQQRQELPQL